MNSITPTPHPCSNPGCHEVGNFQRCSKCKSVYYHSIDCQRAHWNHGHKEECADLTKKKIEDVTAQAKTLSSNAKVLKEESMKLLNSSTSRARSAVFQALRIYSHGFESEEAFDDFINNGMSTIASVMEEREQSITLDETAKSELKEAEKLIKKAEKLKANLDASPTNSQVAGSKTLIAT